MARKQNQDTPEIGFKSIQLLKTQTLGIGSYGKVCKAKCDDLLCAAKIIHETLFDQSAQQKKIMKRLHKEHRLPFRRFQQECEFMSAIKHTNIVQYLGTYQDPETGLPVLLMELMDKNLTQFLDGSQYPVPYHIQVNFCHDITLAISYLHSNGIIHRDLSSNNVLLRGNVIAKVTDFGMAKLGVANPRAPHNSLTMAPGTDAYMPPEAVKNPPVYTAKIDCFAIGAIAIQILTRCFPHPADRHKSIQIDHPQFPGGTADVRVPEIERRQNHISLVGLNHPLLPIALQCLKDSDAERPSAQELCHTVAALKETSQYTESVRSSRPEQEDTSEREEQIRELQQQIQQKGEEIQEKDEVIQLRDQKIQVLEQIIGLQNDHLEENEQTAAANKKECQQLRETIKDKNLLIEEKERQLQHISQNLKASQQVTAQLQLRIKDSELQPFKVKRNSLPAEEHPQPSFRDSARRTSSTASASDKFELHWREGRKIARRMYRGPNAVMHGDTVYLISDHYLDRTIYAYNSTEGTWKQLEACPNSSCSLAVVNNLLTTIGGRKDGEVTNQLFSFTSRYMHTNTWMEVFPPMPTKRESTIALVRTKQALIIAGGYGQNLRTLKTVEVMDIDTQQWSTAPDLPEPIINASATICGNRIYMLGGWSNNGPTKSVYACAFADLFPFGQSKSQGARFAQSLTLTRRARSNVWNKVANLPVTLSTCVTLNGRLLAIGGFDSDHTPTSDIRSYNATSKRWETVSNMTVARAVCFADVLPDNQLLVAGGYIGKAMDSTTDSVEIATID